MVPLSHPLTRRHVYWFSVVPLASSDTPITSSLGISVFPRIIPFNTSFGLDQDSISFGQRGTCTHDAKIMLGNKEYEYGDKVGLEVDMKRRRLSYYINGERQPIVFINIPLQVVIAVCLSHLLLYIYMFICLYIYIFLYITFKSFSKIIILFLLFISTH